MPAHSGKETVPRHEPAGIHEPGAANGYTVGHRQPLDLPGVLIASAALVAITYGLVEGQSYHWGTVWSFISIPLIIGVGVALLVIFVRGSFDAGEPIDTAVALLACGALAVQGWQRERAAHELVRARRA